MEAQHRHQIAETAWSGQPDVALEHQNSLGELTARQGVVTNNMDSRRIETHHSHNQQMLVLSVHNQAMSLLHTHASQSGATHNRGS